MYPTQPDAPNTRTQAKDLKLACEVSIFTNSRQNFPISSDEAKQQPSLSFYYHWFKGLQLSQRYLHKEAIGYFKAAIAIAEDLHTDTDELTELLIDYAGALINERQKNEAHTLIEQAAQLIGQTNNRRLLARLYIRDGATHMLDKSWDDAVRCIKEAENIYENNQFDGIKDRYFQSLLYAHLGFIFQEADDLAASAAYFRKTIEVCKKNNITTRLSWHYLNLGNTYLAKDDMDAARVNFTLALETEGDLSEMARAGALANLGYLGYRNADYILALAQLEEAADIYSTQKEPNNSALSKILLWSALIHLQQQQIPQAETFLTEAMRLAKTANDKRMIAEVSNEVASYFASIGNFAEAYEYQRLHAEYHAAHILELNTNRIKELELSYEIEKKNREAEQLRAETARLQLKALRAQINPHFLFNAMNAIQSIIAEDQDTASTLLAKFARLLRKILDYSDLDKITLEQEAAFLKEYLHLNIELRFGNSMTYHIHINDDLEDDLARIPSMIVQPFVENAIEHGLKPQKGGHISIIFQPEGDDRLRCIVEDNGIGRGELRNRNESRDQVLRKTPRGTGITEQRIALIGQSFASPCNVTYTDLSHANGTPAGTRVDIVMPLEYD